MPFGQIQCADLSRWSGEAEASAWRSVLRSVGELVGAAPKATRTTAPDLHRPSIAVLPFRDLSPERDQDYFCEGVAEEITSALAPAPGPEGRGSIRGLPLRGWRA